MRVKDNINERTTTNRSYRKWLKNCILFYYQKSLGNFLCKRDPKLWAFGAWEGTKYSDNSKYLFEYVSNHNPDITCIWFTKNESVFHKLKQDNVSVCMIGTEKSSFYQRRAGVAFFTNGLDDFGIDPFIYGAKIVCLWHGIGIKRNYYTRNTHRTWVGSFLSKCKAIIFSYIYRDLTISSSEFVSMLYRMESLTKKDICIIGQPRNDVFAIKNLSLSDAFSADFIERFNLDVNTKFITYMPTYRGNGASQAFLDELISDIVVNNDLNEFLQFTGVKLLIKTHYLTNIVNMHVNQNIILINDRELSCVQKLLAVTDMLITDYSTCSIDFAIQHRPILFFVPDLEQYQIDNGLYNEFVDLITGHEVYCFEDLLLEIKKWYYDDYYDFQMVETINGLYNTYSDRAGSYCETILKEIRSRYNIK